MNKSFDKQAFLKEVSEKLTLEINPDVDMGLVLFFENTYKVQIEFLEETILLSSIIGEILPSKFREKVFEDAMKSNFKTAYSGVLGYSDHQKNLILVLSYPVNPPSTDDFAPLLEAFIKKAKDWTEGLKNSNTRLLV